MAEVFDVLIFLLLCVLHAAFFPLLPAARPSFASVPRRCRSCVTLCELSGQPSAPMKRGCSLVDGRMINCPGILIDKLSMNRFLSFFSFVRFPCQAVSFFSLSTFLLDSRC